AVFFDQYATVKRDYELFNLVRAKMDDIMMTTIMTWNGMKFDLVKAAKTLEPMDKEIEALLKEIGDLGQPYFAEDFTFNPESPTQMSLLLYGGDYKVERDLPKYKPDGTVETFKGGQRAGQVKTKKTKVVEHTDGLKLPTKDIPKS